VLEPWLFTLRNPLIGQRGLYHFIVDLVLFGFCLALLCLDALCWLVCVVKRPSPSCTAAKALLRAFFTNRHRSIWRLANGSLPVIRARAASTDEGAPPPRMAINTRNNMPDVHSGLVDKEAVFDRGLSSWFSPVVPTRRIKAAV
jgi:hypothetical protein